MKLAEYVFPGLRSYALGPLAGSIGLRSSEAAHRAGADAELTARVLMAMSIALAAKWSLPFLHASMLDDLTKRQISCAA